MLSSLRLFSANDIAKKRMEMISFYEQVGEAATNQAFGADRRVISWWKKRLAGSGGKLSSLVPHSTRPRRIRTPQTDPRIVAFIKKEREDHPRIGKEKLKPDVDTHCQSLGISTVSTSTIGTIIKRHHFFFQKAGKVYHHTPASTCARNKTKKKRLRMKQSPKPETYGHILSDTVERITDGMKEYFISAIDAKMKVALTLRYKRITSENMKDFSLRFKTVYPGRIIAWQSDNGSENLGVFDRELEKDGVPHLFIYPRCPKINTFIERYNRTLQEECIDYHEDVIHDHSIFAKRLVDWNVYYNTKRRHHSLGLKSPLQSCVDNGGMSQMSMSDHGIGKGSQGIEISPQVGRHIDVLNLAQRIAQRKFGTSIDGLRWQGEPTDDYSKIKEVIKRSNFRSRIVGPGDQFVSDYQIWRETSKAGSHKMDFHEWRLTRNEAYKAEYERLSNELGENQ